MFLDWPDIAGFLIVVLFLFQRFIHDHVAEDYLLVGFHGKNQNPFREKSSCSVI